MNAASANDFTFEELTPDPVAIRACENCGVTSSNGAYLSEVLSVEGTALLCDDCAEADARLEAQADELAKLPSCEERSMIIDTAQTTAQLVNRLKAHDLAGCPTCAAVRTRGERIGRMAEAQATKKEAA